MDGMGYKSHELGMFLNSFDISCFALDILDFVFISQVVRFDPVLILVPWFFYWKNGSPVLHFKASIPIQSPHVLNDIKQNGGSGFLLVPFIINAINTPEKLA